MIFSPLPRTSNAHASSVADPVRLNGIDVASLRQVIEAMMDNPALARSHWRVSSAWRGGTRTDHVFNGSSVGGERVSRHFTLCLDGPAGLGGGDRFASPQEHLLAAVSACTMIGYVTFAALMGITLTKLEIEIDGDIDLQGFLAIDAGTPAGFTRLVQTVRIAGDADPARFEELHDIVLATSPNLASLARPVDVQSTLIVG